MINPQFQFCKTKFGFSRCISVSPLQQHCKKRANILVVQVRVKTFTPEVAEKIDLIAKTCETPVLKYLMENWDKAENLTDEKINQLRERELQLKEQGFDTFKRLCRLKISIANSNNTPWNAGKKRSEATRKKIQASLKEKYKSDPVLKEKLRNRMKGFTHTEESKAKIKRSLDIRFADSRKRREAEKAERLAKREKLLEEKRLARLQKEEEKQRLKRERQNTKPYDLIKKNDPKGYERMMEEKRKKISETIRKRWQDPEYRERIVSGIQRYRAMTDKPQRKISDETRRKISQASKAVWEERRQQESTPASVQSPASKARQKKEEVVDTAQELMSHLIQTKQQAHDLQQNILRLEGALEHLRNDVQQLEQATKSLERAKQILQHLELTESNIKSCIASVLGPDQMQDVEELVSSQIVTSQPVAQPVEQSTAKPQVSRKNGNSNGAVDASKSFEVSSNNTAESQFVNGRHQNGEPEFLV